MKSLSAEFQAHLDSGSTTMCWCWRVERRDGVVLGFTDHDEPVTFLGLRCEAESGFTASEIRAGSELSVDSQDAQGVLSSDRISETDIVDGQFDGAVVEVWRVNWQAPEQRVLLRRGVIGEIRRGRVAFAAEMRSLSHALDQAVGRTYQYSCDCALGDGRCMVDLSGAGFAGSGVVLGVDGDRSIRASGLGAFAAGWFSNGVLTWSSGASAGRAAEIISHDLAGGDVWITLLEAPVLSIGAGDAFSITVGCDKTADVCASRFSNIINYRGFPHIPGQDTVIRYATQSSANTGEPL